MSRPVEVADLSDLYARPRTWTPYLPDVVRDLVSVDGVPYAVPTNIHRANLLWANPSVLSAAGVTATASYLTLDDWFVVLEKVKQSGRTPLVLGAPWTQVHLLEQVLLSRLGAERLRRAVGPGAPTRPHPRSPPRSRTSPAWSATPTPTATRSTGPMSPSACATARPRSW